MTSPAAELRVALAAIVSLLIAAPALAGAPAKAGKANIDSPEYWKPAWKRLAARGKGFVVWESIRTGSYRIWYRNLDGSGLRQVSPDEKGRWHYAAHISPDGKRLVYISYPPDYWQDGFQPNRPGVKNPMYIINVDGTGNRLLLKSIHTYQEHRAAVWLNNREIICIDGDGFTQQLNVDTGKSFPLTKTGDKEFGWLINPTKTHATSRSIWLTFSRYDPKTKTVTKGKVFGGCQPYFARDGIWGIYVGGSGGPLMRVLLSTQKATQIVRHNDPRMPANRHYMYFPMLSANQRLFAFGAAPKRTWDRAPGSDFDIFVAPCNPKTLELLDKPARYSFTKGNDRFPDVFIVPKDEKDRIATAEPPEAPPHKVAPQSPWPTTRKGLMFLWQDSDSDNLSPDPVSGETRSYVPTYRGETWLDHDHALHLTGRGSLLAQEAGANLVTGCKKSGALSIEVTLHVAQANLRGGPACILALAPDKDPKLEAADFVLAQQGQKLVFGLKTAGDKAAKTKRPPRWITLADKLPTDKPVHVLVSYVPGKLTATLDGKPVAIPAAAQLAGALDNWTPGELILGGDGTGKGGWPGTLEGLAVYTRALSAAEAAANRAEYAKLLAARKPVPKLTVQALLLARADIPRPKDLGTYRSALVFYEYQLEKSLSGPAAPKRFRVAHWAILDRKLLGLDKREAGKSFKLVLEPFDANPQLRTIPRRDAPLLEDFDIPLYFETGR